MATFFSLFWPRNKYCKGGFSKSQHAKLRCGCHVTNYDDGGERARRAIVVGGLSAVPRARTVGRPCVYYRSYSRAYPRRNKFVSLPSSLRVSNKSSSDRAARTHTALVAVRDIVTSRRSFVVGKTHGYLRVLVHNRRHLVATDCSSSSSRLVPLFVFFLFFFFRPCNRVSRA